MQSTLNMHLLQMHAFARHIMPPRKILEICPRKIESGKGFDYNNEPIGG